MYCIKNIISQFSFIVGLGFQGEGPKLSFPEGNEGQTKGPDSRTGSLDKASLQRRAEVLSFSLGDVVDKTGTRVEALKGVTGVNVNSAEGLSMGERVGDGEDGKNLEGVEKSMGIEVLSKGKVSEVIQGIQNDGSGLVISDVISNEVLASFDREPFDTEGLSEVEINEEITRRTISVKAEQTKSRVLSDGVDGSEAITEADFIKGLEEEFGLDQDALMSLRVRNQAGIGADIDTTGNITDPEQYMNDMRELAERAKQAQDFLLVPKNQEMIAAGNNEIYAEALAIINGTELNENNLGEFTALANSDSSLGDGFSTMSRLTGSSVGGFENSGTPSGRVSFNPSQLKDLPPASLEKAEDLGKMFGSAIDKYPNYGIPREWANDPNLHKVVMKESGGIVGRLNYTFDAVAKRMGTKIDDPQFVTYIHNQLKEGKRASDFGIRSTASGVGQFIRANVIAYYPDQFNGIGNAENECIGMMRYIKDRYGTPANTVAQYGKKHEGY